ncbi:ArgS-related anticodon-binding protein NrtL [Streptomyces sp. NPDC002004]
MTPVELSRTLLHAVRRAVDDGELSVTVPARAVVERPRPGGRGDYATNIALQLARTAGRPPRQIAEIVRHRLTGTPGVAGVEITGPGFLNITLDGGAAALVRDILRQGPGYGHGDTLAGQLVELRVPHEVRAEAVADAVVRIVASQGGHAEVSHAEPVNLRPVPAPGDPAPLGPDAARWALLHPAAHDHPRITEDHLVQRETNPLFRVRYAHARTRALVRNAADLGFVAEPGDVQAEPGDARTESGEVRPGAPGVPTGTGAHGGVPQDVVAELLAALSDHPVVLAAAARHRAPDRVARHLVVLADAFFRFHDATRVLPVGDEKPTAAHRARLALAEAAGTVLAGGLSLLGIDAPDHL